MTDYGQRYHKLVYQTSEMGYQLCQLNGIRQVTTREHYAN